MKNFLNRSWTKALIFVTATFFLAACTQKVITSMKLADNHVRQFEKTEFDVSISSDFKNPYDEREIALDMVITSPSQKTLMLPCYYVLGDNKKSYWKAR